MNVTADLSALGKTKWYEYAVRFVFGGIVTVLAGLIAKNFGPGVGGLFLAFPAIFPASATLIEKHEKQKKERAGMSGTQRARNAAGVDAAGAAIGTIGLLCFAVLVWQLITTYQTWIVLTAATFAWLIVSVLIWHLRK
jgi:Protein of unknown function (DUF3147)